ncbi:MAG: DUF3482 domain-containing protein [Betaproteobacteria bacterium]|nr:DUF3482 domain-containing protein [Betaproteobacteria bacterium]
MSEPGRAGECPAPGAVLATDGSPQQIALSLVSHTNAGKTTLARTLLGRDVGEVRDAAHVTTSAERHVMIETAQGDALSLWDTPGFGDSARLGRRLAALDNPILEFLASSWDRWRDRPFWSSQQAVRNVREHADVVLYLVNASERPQDAGYLAPEMQILEWIGKPVVVLLNQIGVPHGPADDAADIGRWRNALGARPIIRGVLALDAFARCWVQERTLLRAVAAALPASRQEAFARLASAWQAARERQFDQAMAAIALPIARAACDREGLPDAGFRGSLREVGKAMGIPGRDGGTKEAAMSALALRLDADLRASTDRLIAIHRLEGRAAAEVTARLADSVVTDAPVDERKAAVVGGFVSGALTGLAADLAAGGLTFGAGLLAGGVVGALGAAGLARGFNLVRGTTESSLRWTDEFIAALVPAAILRYLAVAHYGRGRGEWTASEHPAIWRNVVEATIARRTRLSTASPWTQRAGGCDPERLAGPVAAMLRDIAREVLDTLYPAA